MSFDFLVPCLHSFMSDISSSESRRALKGPRFLSQRLGPGSSARLTVENQVKVYNIHKTLSDNPHYDQCHLKQKTETEHFLFNVNILNPTRTRVQMLWKLP